MSESRTLRRAKERGKRPQDVTVKCTRPGRADIYARRDYVAWPFVRELLGIAQADPLRIVAIPAKGHGKAIKC